MLSFCEKEKPFVSKSISGLARTAESGHVPNQPVPGSAPLIEPRFVLMADETTEHSPFPKTKNSELAADEISTVLLASPAIPSPEARQTPIKESSALLGTDLTTDAGVETTRTSVVVGAGRESLEAQLTTRTAQRKGPSFVNKFVYPWCNSPNL
jgi:hypothetical protein